MSTREIDAMNEVESGQDRIMNLLNDELTKAYLGGLIDAAGSLNVKVIKNDKYSMGYNIAPDFTVTKREPTAIQILDDWAASNGINANVNEYDGKFQFSITRVEDLKRLLRLLEPYMMAKHEIVVMLLEDLLPTIEEKEFRDSKEAFVEAVEKIEEMRDLASYRDSDRKYTSEYFREEWADELES